MFEQRFHVRSYEVDMLHSIMPSSLLNYMQEVASNHAENLGFGYQAMLDQKRAWVLSRSRVQLSGKAKIGEEIHIKTWLSGVDRLFGMRDFLISTSSGHEIASARSAWLMVDLDSRKPLRLSSLPVLSSSQQPPVFAEALEKIEVPEGAVPIYQREIGYSCIDINQHVNNVKYIEFALDALPEEFFVEHRLTALQINFLNETKYGDTLSVARSQPAPDRVYIEGSKNGSLAFQTLLEFKTNGG